ncbi:MAG: DEAD/DEAH box helicase [Litorilinea sp.]
MKFEELNLDARLLAGVELSGFTTPTPIQEQAIPEVLTGRDLLGLAQTGTGKTAAFALPILQRLLTGKLGVVRALIVAPTRELAEQIHEAFVLLGKKTRIRSVTVYGGVSKYRQAMALRRGAEIVVACPGRLLDHVGDGSIDLTNVEVLVLDEADRMCDMGFLPDIRRILRLVPSERQTLFFSATMPSEIRTLSAEMLKDPAKVEIDMLVPVKSVKHALYPVPESLKTKLLLSMLEQTPTGRVLVFTRTKRRANNLARDLERSRYRVSSLQGNMAQNQRQAALNGFREGKFDILVATDIAARGIDVTDISHVINFDMPDTVDAYTHRIGRTGRAQASGEAFTLTLPTDEPAIRAIESAVGSEIERRRLPDFDYGSFDPTWQPPRNRNGGGGGSTLRGNMSGGGARRGGRPGGFSGGGARRSSRMGGGSNNTRSGSSNGRGGSSNGRSGSNNRQGSSSYAGR